MAKSVGGADHRKVWTVAATLWMSALGQPSEIQGQTDQVQADPGEQVFTTVCVGCHTIGGGRLVGPDLAGLGDRRTEAWIIDFVQGSQALITSGDPVAVALFEEFNSIPMPDNALSDDEVRAVIAYIQRTEAAETTPGAVAVQPPAVPAATPAEIRLGLDLFQGTRRFTQRGPTCNSCHDVANDAVLGGGSLARELTTVFSRIGGPGVRAILADPPFPVMQRAYFGISLTDEEITALVGFLEKVDEEQALHQPRAYGMKLVGAGIAGVGALFGLFSLAWGQRKRGSVNQEIFDRQIRSS